MIVSLSLSLSLSFYGYNNFCPFRRSRWSAARPDFRVRCFFAFFFLFLISCSYCYLKRDIYKEIRIKKKHTLFLSFRFDHLQIKKVFSRWPPCDSIDSFHSFVNKCLHLYIFVLPSSSSSSRIIITFTSPSSPNTYNDSTRAPRAIGPSDYF